MKRGEGRACDPAPDTNITTLILSLTTYTRRATPEQIERQMRLAYNDHGPDSYKRWRDQQSVLGTDVIRACARCGKPLLRDRLTWCSNSCRYDLPPRPVLTREEIVAEMETALARSVAER